MENRDEKYIIIVSNTASERLVSHARFLTKVSEQAAEILIEEFQAKAKSLAEFPEGNPWLSDSTLHINKYRKLLIYKRYLLIYQIKGKTVYVDYVLDCRQDYNWLL